MKRIFSILSVLGFMFFCGNALGAAQSNALRELTVSMQGEGGEYESIGAALAEADGSTPYLIKVMPGTYLENITINKNNIHLQGSGRDVTIIDSNAQQTITSSVTTMIEDLTIRNGGAVNNPSAIYHDSGKLTLNNVKVEMNVSVATDAYTIWLKNSGTSLDIKNSTIEVTTEPSLVSYGAVGIHAESSTVLEVSNTNINIDSSNSTVSWNSGIWFRGTTAKVMNSTIKSIEAEHNYGIESYSKVEVLSSKIELINNLPSTEVIGIKDAYLVSGSLVKVSGASGKVKAVTGKSSVGAKVIGSHLEASVTNGSVYTVDGGSMQIIDSSIKASGGGTVCALYGWVYVGGSVIDGNPCDYGKIVNSWDGNFNPIANY